MPELPEVEALRTFLADTCVGKTIARTELAAFASLKTFELPLSALHGLEVDGVERRGKFICLSVGGLWLVFHLARGGWLSWKDAMPLKPARPGRGPLAARVVFDDDSGFDLTEAGTQKRLALYVVERPRRGARDRHARPRPDGRRLHPGGARRHPRRGRTLPAQGRAARPAGRSPASATPTPTRSCTPRG